MILLSVARPSLKKNLYELVKCASDVHTTPVAYVRVADDLRASIESDRNAASTEGLQCDLRIWAD